MSNLSLAISTCPNDTYIFGGLINKLIDTDMMFDITFEDIENLNNLAINREIDICKVSFGVYHKISSDYYILSAGAALGYNTGPILVSKQNLSVDGLSGKKIAIPGVNTTANLLFDTLYKGIKVEKIEMRFDKIISAVESGEVDIGILIHEGRFIYKEFGLNLVVDLGVEYFNLFGLPTPLGFIAIRKSLVDIAKPMNESIRRSINFAKRNYFEIESFVKEHAQDMNDDVIKSHIDLYVNKYSYDLNVSKDAIYKFLNIDLKEEIIV